MNRCAPLSLALALAGALPALAQAQDAQALQRKFPQDALRGTAVFGTPPAIVLNGKPVQMAPSYRIHGVDNLIVMSGQLVGRKAMVDYTTDTQGAVREVWILSPAETARLWPVNATQTASWAFEPATQTWTKP